CKIDIEHSARSVFDVRSQLPAATPLLFFEPVSDVSRHCFQFFRIEAQCVGMDSMTCVCLDHLSEFLIAADATQFDVRQPLPRRTFISQVIEKTFCARDEWSVLAVRPQTQVNSLEITFPRNARKCYKHQLHQTR